MAMADYVGVLLPAVAQPRSSIQMATEDMKGAYRQVPLTPSHMCDMQQQLYMTPHKERSNFT